ncbi:hypothetical protein KVH27_27990 [Streptomyces olivaceus]|uniref:hypothetical protein n=1 Tax=Streptomyces olivaceus TaxID=47716 RepID=UPI001CCEE861|nr:hypothetical protein [Streptomyces olivaceus]MBZ6252192.1 hypothetical protein [Streptomyces olivaceus]
MSAGNDSIRAWLTRGSVASGIAFTATAEYDLALALGASRPVAVMLPLALDLYVIAALRWFRRADIALSLALMGAAQVAAHLLSADVMTVNTPMVTIVSLLVPVSIWRTHALARPVPDPAPAAPAPAAEDVPAPEPEAVPVPVSLVKAPVPPAVPAAPSRVRAPRTRRTGRTRTRAVPAPAPAGTPDPLVETARTALGGTPSVRQLRAEYGIGQTRAQKIRDELATAGVTP